MKMQSWKTLVLVAPAVLIAGVACSPAPSIKERISLTPSANEKALNEMEWITSEANPTKIFADLRGAMATNPDDQNLPNEVCESLKKYEDDRSLFIFENEIRAASNKTILGQCRDHLLQKIEKIHAKNREEMKAKGFAVLNYGRIKNVLSLDLQNPDSQSEILKNVFAEVNGARIPQVKTEIQLRDVSKGYVAIRGDVQPKQVILTFDDGPHPLMTPLVAAALKSAETKGMFFTLGQAAKRSPWVTQDLARDGHVIANHSFSHPYMGPLEACKGEDCRKSWVTEKEAIFELQKTHQLLFDVVGGVEPFVRFPFGARTKGLGEFLKANGLGEFFWNVDSEDWKFSHSNEEILDRMMAQVEKDQRGIILMHDIHRRTAEIVPELLNRLAKGGYTVVLLRAEDSLAQTQNALIQGQGLQYPASVQQPQALQNP
jgi:peptidoglycan/xylan/chitin deacetylase (PgdA/CDA1 family)